MNGPVRFPRRSRALRAAVERCCSSLQTLAFWLAVGLPVAYLLAFLYPVGPLSSVEGLSTALAVHAAALVVGHPRHRERGER